MIAIRSLIFSAIALFATPTLAQSITPRVGGSSAKQVTEVGKNEFMLGTTLMFLQTKATQGGQELPGGTSRYSQANVQYNVGSYFCGFGLVYQSDQLGNVQNDTGLGAKIELTWQGFYLEAGYGTAQQRFRNRTVSSREGTQTFFASGIRVPFFADVLYFDGGLRQRSTVFSKQDGAKLHAPLRQTLTMPYIGVGMAL